MTMLQYRDYLFAHNPRRIELSFSHNVVAHSLPARGALAQSLGPRLRTVRCEGEVFGQTPAAAFERLAALSAMAADGSSGTLYLPTGEQFAALVTRFAYAAQGDGCTIAYTLDWLEAAKETEVVA